MRRLVGCVTALALQLGATGTALAQDDATAARLQQLEKRNAELEQRLRKLEGATEHVQKSLETDKISENEPELVSRLKAVELQTLAMQKPIRTVEDLDGVSTAISFTTVAQAPRGDLTREASQLNYRGDLSVSVPLGSSLGGDNQLFASFRLGQGSGLNGVSAFSKPNAAAFRVLSTTPDDSVAVLGQVGYRGRVALPIGGFPAHSREAFEFAFGKMDPFAFFDQNAAANDESKQFLNTAFVHNPLLDAGGDMGVDANGFSPGLWLSYVNERNKRQVWRVSGGVFGAGAGANYSRVFSAPLLIAQAETQWPGWDGQRAQMRLYTWRNGQATQLDETTGKHAGWGVSLDQRVGDGIVLFGRYGQRYQGQASFNRALTLGAEISGLYWKRGADTLGVALGNLPTSREARLVSDEALAKAEHVAEIYYRYRVNPHLELTPDVQWIQHAAGARQRANALVLGLRVQVNY